MKRLYPIFARLEGLKIVVVGGGRVAQRKVESLLESGAEILVISPELTADLTKRFEQGEIKVLQRPYNKGDLADAWLVIAATGNKTIDEAISTEAKDNRILCNVVDDTQLCSFQVPSLLSQGNLQIAVSTGGASPALAKRIREKLEEEFGVYYEDFLTGISELRSHVKAKYSQDQEKRRSILESFPETKCLEFLREGKKGEFRELLEKWKNM